MTLKVPILSCYYHNATISNRIGWNKLQTAMPSNICQLKVTVSEATLASQFSFMKSYIVRHIKSTSLKGQLQRVRMLAFPLLNSHDVSNWKEFGRNKYQKTHWHSFVVACLYRPMGSCTTGFLEDFLVFSVFFVLNWFQFHCLW